MSDDTPKQPNTEYGADSITVLEGLEAVRVRPAMYIGDTDVRGLHHLIWEVVDNSIDEALAGRASRCDVKLNLDGSVTVIDDGHGIPVKIHPEEGVPAVELVLTKLHAGGKFDNDAYKVSGGLHGVGVSCVNALSEWLEVTVHQDGKVHNMRFERGLKVRDLEVVGDTDRHGTEITFKPDHQIFSTVEIDYEIVAKRLRETAYLMGSQGVALYLEDERIGKKDEFVFPSGLLAFVDQLCKNKERVLPETVHWMRTMETDENPGAEYRVELSFQYTDAYNEQIFTFVNNINTHGGGTHLTGLKAGMTRTFNNYIKSEKLSKSEKLPSGDDFREGICAVLSVYVPDPQFEGQTKDKLGNREVAGLVESFLAESFQTYLEEHPGPAKNLAQRAMRAMEARDAARKARDLVRRKTVLASGNMPGKLADCQSKSMEESELYLVEGDSAGGSAKEGRDRRYQAILPLKGKILNVEKARLDKMLQHSEIQTIISALGCGIADEFDLERLRYGKTIIMTDADVDGSHIRTLLLTFFFRHMKPLIEQGRLYIAQPPLYKAKKGKKVVYLKDDKELTEYLFTQGAAGIRIEASGRDSSIEGTEVQAYLEAVRGFLASLERVSRRFDERVMYAFTESFSGDADTTGDRAAMEEVLAATKARLEELYRPDDIRLTQFTVDPSDEDEGHRLTFRTRENGVDRLTVIDRKLIGGAEFADLRRRFDAARTFGRAPFVLHSGKADPAEYATAKQLYERIDKDSRKGYDIQRYKGLGEMNPDQLWETTMDPEVRTLVQVKVEDIIEADEIFTLLMGDAVEPRRDFIQTNALNVRNLDV